MVYACRSCEYSEARGCLPAATCGLYMFGLMALWGNVTFAVIRLQWLPEHLPWWAWLIILPLNLISAIVGGLLLDLLLQAIEWLMFARRRCPRCGERQWSWGYNEGFGL